MVSLKTRMALVALAIAIAVVVAATGLLYASQAPATTGAENAGHLATSAAESPEASNLPERPVDGEEAAVELPEIAPIATAAPKPPALFYISKLQRCTSFDLKGGRLNFVATNLVQVYPLVYQGKNGNFHIFWEASPYGWTWLFEDKGGTTGAVYYKRKPTEPTRVFDAKAGRAVRTP